MNKEIQDIVIVFAGDSGDGMQMIGSQFTHTAALTGNDVITLPDFPSEIRAPGGTVAGVSRFKLHASSTQIYSPGDTCDVLVAMNAAAYKKSKNQLKKDGILIANISGFDARNLRSAQVEMAPWEQLNVPYKVYPIDITKNTRESLKDSGLSTKEIDRSKNLYALGFVYWLFNKDIKYSLEFLENRFQKNPSLLQSNSKVLKDGYTFGEITDTFSERYVIGKAKVSPGTYRSVSGNQALSLGLMSAAHQMDKEVFYGSYPITPASDILHFLSKYKHLGIKTFQAEDEIAAITAAIGASYAGGLGVCASSGPGIALKAEAMGLAVMTELPLVIINVQRGGPSTGLPTKTEQSDLMQAVYGRNGEAPIPVIAAHTPAGCFKAAYDACKIAVERNTPVILLSDGYLANGSEPWKFPKVEELDSISPAIVNEYSDEIYKPYERDGKKVRSLAVPGMKGKEHRVGGLEKSDMYGEVSYDPENHQKMVRLRQEKISNIAKEYPSTQIDNGLDAGDVLVLAWGSTYGSIKEAVAKLLEEGHKVAHIHLTHVYPLPTDLKDITSRFKTILVPELNEGQLIHLLQSFLGISCVGYHKTMGQPLTTHEIYNKIMKYL